MSNMYELLKNGLVDFVSLITDRYLEIGLDEIDTMIIIKLKKATDSGLIDSKALSSGMSLTETELGDRIVSLVKNQYIDLLENKDDKIICSFDLVYKRLASIVDKNSDNNENQEAETEIRKIATFLQHNLSKNISSTELEVVKHWIDVDKYAYKDIQDATLKCLQNKKASIKYIDAILRKSDKRSNNSIKTDQDIDQLFRKMYGKLKG
ncbi:MAG: DnaD domain protein [Bacilli bacterium]